MNIKQAKSMTFDELRNEYKKYLNSFNLSNNTIKTAYTDTFYLWNKLGADLFWEIVTDSDFENQAGIILLEELKKGTSSDPQKLVSGYISHIRRFRNFINITDCEPESSKMQKSNNKKQSSDLIKIPKPCKIQMKYYLLQWDKLENYRIQEEALDKLFCILCPENKSISDILLKASALNDFYSTNILSVYPVAKHIFELNIDDRLNKGDITLVDDIKKNQYDNKEKNFYSFATKFCSHHNPLCFPIYDYYVEQVLIYFRNCDNFDTFKNKDLKDYKQFKSIINSFRKFYGLEDYNLKELDKYLWQLGKRYMPKNKK